MSGPTAPSDGFGFGRTGTGGGRRLLGTVGLALVIVSAMDSVRNLPTTATFGWACVFLYGVAIFAYVVPVAMTSAELSTMVGGGMYDWVRAGLGSRLGLLAVWCDWSENIVWFPTVLVFLATTAAYVLDPALAQDKAFLLPMMLVLFWATTAVAFLGPLHSARWTGVGITVGTVLPTAVIISLGLWWVVSGHHLQAPLHPGALVPAWRGLSSLVYAAGIVVAFAGMEIGGFYSHVTRDVKSVYPRAVLLAALVVAGSSILGSVAIAVVVPRSQLSLAGGLMQALSFFFGQLGMAPLVRPLGFLVIVGAMFSLVSWSVGPAEGMRAIAADGRLSGWWGWSNRRGAPISVLVLQAVLGTALCLLMLLVRNINTYYWMLTSLVAQTFLVMYLLMYLSVIRLRLTRPEAPRPFRIPGGGPGLIAVVGTGIVGALFTFVLGFVPANPLSGPATAAYVAVMGLGMLIVVATPFLLHRGREEATPYAAAMSVVTAANHTTETKVTTNPSQAATSQPDLA
jgi:amino acid transporter